MTAAEGVALGLGVGPELVLPIELAALAALVLVAVLGTLAVGAAVDAGVRVSDCEGAKGVAEGLSV